MSKITQEISPLPDRNPEPVFTPEQLVWTDEEQQLIERFKSQYPTTTAAVMKTLWLAQEKFGFLPMEVLNLVADTLDLPYAHVFGVATFYTQYYKEEVGKFVLDVCTCFTCQMCGGYDMLYYLEEKLGVRAGETTPDGLFTLQEAQCLGACGSAPMLQVTNGEYVHHLSREKIDRLVEDLRAGEKLPFTSITLPQDEDEMGGNRRSDVTVTEPSTPPPFAEHHR